MKFVVNAGFRRPSRTVSGRYFLLHLLVQVSRAFTILGKTNPRGDNWLAQGKVAGLVFDRSESSIPHHPSISWVFGRDWPPIRGFGFIAITFCDLFAVPGGYGRYYTDRHPVDLYTDRPLIMRRYVCIAKALFPTRLFGNSLAGHWYESVPREFPRSLGLSHRSLIDM